VLYLFFWGGKTIKFPCDKRKRKFWSEEKNHAGKKPRLTYKEERKAK